jgi:hypothetical protein
MPRDPYRALGVEADATPSDITAAYRRLAREHHPDVSRTGDAGARMQEINSAYRVLKDPESRAAYDAKQAARAARASRRGRRGADLRGASASGVGSAAATFPGYRIFGTSVDRAIVGVLASLVILIGALLFAGDGVYWGASLALAVGCWVGSVPNPRLSSQHGVAVGVAVGIFLAAMLGATGYSLGDGSNLAGQIACCAPFTLVFGASLGGMLGSAAGWVRRAASLRVQFRRSEES